MSHFDVLMDNITDSSDEHPTAALFAIEDDPAPEEYSAEQASKFCNEHFGKFLPEKKDLATFLKTIECNVSLNNLLTEIPNKLARKYTSRVNGTIKLNAVRAYKVHLELKNRENIGKINRFLSKLPEGDQVKVITFLDQLGSSYRKPILNTLAQN